MKTFKVSSLILLFLFVTISFFAFYNGEEEPAPLESQGLQRREVTTKKKMEIDDWLDGTFSYETMYPVWVSDRHYISKSSEGSFHKINIETEEEELILSMDAWNSTSKASSWEISPDEMFMAIIHKRTDGYAHYVRTFSVDIWSLQNGVKVTLDIPRENIQAFKWAPTGHNFTYVYEFNVYLCLDLKSPISMTSNGNEQMMFNGISDWISSVEITDDDALLWWSPNGQYLAFATIDQMNVDQFEFIVYNELQYPQLIKFPYSKPGEKISSTKITIIELETLVQTEITPNIDENWNNEYWLNSAAWRGNIFTPTWKNRYENKAVIESCIAPNFTCSHGSNTTFESTTGWLGHYEISHIYPIDDDRFLTVQSHNKFPHVALHDISSNSFDMRTSGNFEATDTGYGYKSIHYYDLSNTWVYFTSTENPAEPNEGLSRIRHLWRVRGYGNNVTRECITCSLNTVYSNRCNWVTPSFSMEGLFLVVNCGGTGNGVPISTLHQRDVNGDYQFVRITVNNAEVENNVNEYDFRSLEFGSLQLPGVDGDWNYMLLKPPNFDPDGKYPLLVQVYSGPAFQEVEDRFSVSWKDYVASSKDVVVMSFDGRGTGFRGDEIMHMVYEKLGQYEPLDQIEAARIVAGNTFINASKTAIWGKSYGGYATSRTIAEDKDQVFRCGFAVAPVTRWELYSTIYTERYMKTPQDNPEGYNRSSTLQNFENYKNHQYTLIHGTRDENVHFQNAAQLSKYLIENDVDFGSFFSADDDHGFTRVPNNYKTLFKRLTNEMDICFSD